MTDFDGRIEAGNYAVEYFQTPDGLKDESGKVRRQARYSKEAGYDSAQQDNAIVVPGAPDINEEGLRNLFRGMDRALRGDRKFELSGSTASVAHISKDGILTVANAGDSPVTIYVRDPKTGSIVDSHLISTSHNTTAASAAEKKRVEAMNGFFAMIDGHLRLDGILMLTRSLGNNGLDGVTAMPDIATHDLKQYFKKGLEVIVAVESDGVTEATAEEARLDKLGALAQGGKPVRNVPQQLAALAVADGATDNITSLAAILRAPPAENVMMAVFDGNGQNGAAAAHCAVEYLAERFGQSPRMVRSINPDMGEVEAATPAATSALTSAASKADITNAQIILDKKWEVFSNRAGKPAIVIDIKTLAPENLARLKSALTAEGLQWETRRSSYNGGTDVLEVEKDGMLAFQQAQNRAAISGVKWKNVQDGEGKFVSMVDVKETPPEKLARLKQALDNVGIDWETRLSSYKGGKEVLVVGSAALGSYEVSQEKQAQPKTEPQGPGRGQAGIRKRPPKRPGM